MSCQFTTLLTNVSFVAGRRALSFRIKPHAECSSVEGGPLQPNSAWRPLDQPERKNFKRQGIRKLLFNLFPTRLVTFTCVTTVLNGSNVNAV